MRVQTSFEKFAQATSGQLFALNFVSLRILLGVSSIYFSTFLPELSVQDLWNGSLWFHGVLPVVLVLLGVSLILGLLVRPVALLAILAAIVSVLAFLHLKVDPYHILPVLGLLLLLGLFTAGGAGHIFGIDGVILRNLRRPSFFARFLFG